MKYDPWTRRRRFARAALLGVLGLSLGTAGLAQPAPGGQASQATGRPPVTAYGPALTLAVARRAMMAAEALSARDGLRQAIAIVDSGGHLVMFHKADDTILAALPVAQGKARTAVDYRRPTETIEEALAAGGGGLRYLGVPGTMPLKGGVPIISGGRVVGAIGVAGAAADDDVRVAQAGADAVR